MKNIRVSFKDGYGFITSEREAHQVHAKGFVGEPLSGGGLRLEPMELYYLVSKGTLEAYEKKGKKNLSPQELFLRCQQLDEGFDKHFKVYKEVRDRGFFITPDENYLNVFQPNIKNVGRVPYAKIRCFEEHDRLHLGNVLKEVKRFHKLGIVVLGAVADAEGDVTFFRFGEFGDEGEIDLRKAHLQMVKELEELFAVGAEGAGRLELSFSFSKAKGQCFLTSTWHPEGKVEDIIHGHLFFGKSVAGGLTLGFYEGLYLAELLKSDPKVPEKSIQIIGGGEGAEKEDPSHAREQSNSRLYAVYKDLKKRWLVPKTGFKYGSHFRVYKKLAEGHHAEYLLHVVDDERVPWSWVEVMVRLATGVKKEMVFAFYGSNGKEKIRYLKIVRELPSPGKRDG